MRETYALVDIIMHFILIAISKVQNCLVKQHWTAFLVDIDTNTSQNKRFKCTLHIAFSEYYDHCIRQTS